MNIKLFDTEAPVSADDELRRAKEELRQAKEELEHAKEELLRLARGYYKKIAGSAYISRKDKLRLRLLLTAPVAGPKLWQKLKGGRT